MLKIYFYTRHLILLLFDKKNCALHRRIFQKHPLFTTFLAFLTVDEVCYISDKNQPPNNLAKYQYFYTRDFISLLHFEKKLALFIAKLFRKYPLFTTFSLFLIVGKVCNIQINTDFFINQLKNILTQDTFNPSFDSRKKLRSPQKLLETFSFYYIFTNFHGRNNLISQQNNNSFTKESLYHPFTSRKKKKKKRPPSITNVFQNIYVLPHVHYI